MQVIGIRSAHAGEGIGAQRQGMIEDIFQLAPFVPGNYRMQQIVAFDP
jgi:hypothetical protein